MKQHLELAETALTEAARHLHEAERSTKANRILTYRMLGIMEAQVRELIDAVQVLRETPE